MMASYFGPLSDGAVGAASLIQNSKQQTHILDLTKTVAESALQFMYSCKEGAGNPKVGCAPVRKEQAILKEVLKSQKREEERTNSYLDI